MPSPMSTTPCYPKAPAGPRRLREHCGPTSNSTSPNVSKAAGVDVDAVSWKLKLFKVNEVAIDGGRQVKETFVSGGRVIASEGGVWVSYDACDVEFFDGGGESRQFGVLNVLSEGKFGQKSLTPRPS